MVRKLSWWCDGLVRILGRGSHGLSFEFEWMLCVFTGEVLLFGCCLFEGGWGCCMAVKMTLVEVFLLYFVPYWV